MRQFRSACCGALTRLLLPRSRYEEGVQLAASMLGAVTPGDPWDEACQQGPQISAAAQSRILGMIEQARKDGARLVVGGGIPDVSEGYYVQPTLLADVDPDSTIAQEEIFGPVLVAIPYDDDDDAVRIANNSIYGLFGGVFSADVIGPWTLPSGSGPGRSVSTARRSSASARSVATSRADWAARKIRRVGLRGVLD